MTPRPTQPPQPANSSRSQGRFVRSGEIVAEVKPEQFVHVLDPDSVAIRMALFGSVFYERQRG